MNSADQSLIILLQSPKPAVKYQREQWRRRSLNAVLQAVDTVMYLDREIARSRTDFIHVGDQSTRTILEAEQS